MRRVLAALVTAAVALALAVAGAVSVVPDAGAGPAAAPASPASPADDRAAQPVPAAVAVVKAARAKLAKADKRLRKARSGVRKAERQLRQIRKSRAPRARKARLVKAKRTAVRTGKAKVRRALRARTRARNAVRTAEAKLRAVRPLGKPNVVVFLLDDMRADELNHLPKTRKLLAGSGLELTDAVSAHPLCCPARAQLLTGQYAQNNGVRHNSGVHGGYASYTPASTLATMLSAAGYRTALHGKYLNGYGGSVAQPTEPGWSTWDALVRGTYDYDTFGFVNGDRFRDDYVTDRITERSIATIRRDADRQNPFFVLAGHPAPHYAWGPSWAARHNPPVGKPKYLKAYAGRQAPSLSDPAFAEADLSDKPASWLSSEGRADSRDYVQQQFVHRAAALRSVDDGIAATVEELRRLGELSNTYLVVTSDNGYTLGEHASMGKNVFYDEALTVPMLVSGPGVRAGSSTLPVHLADLAATILDVAGATPTHVLDGRSFVPELRSASGSGEPAWRDTTLLLAGAPQSRAADQWGFRGVRTERYVYGVSWFAPEEEVLFDRMTDPAELTSVHRDPRYAAVRAELRRRAELLSSCVGASCNRSFGALPEPRSGPAEPADPAPEPEQPAPVRDRVLIP
ncbi:sulfatase family protein [Nocardioides pantholopis]|uniref:sulfatase family protein n=1 Tax=Nocardioides pantholopis TaxID=2483798 RepID=UPI000FD86452|nr:sulfatase [Nocardioides pantholopis]